MRANRIDRHAVAVRDTPLVRAVDAGDLEAIEEFVLEDGHQVNEQNQFGGTALHRAAARGNLQVVRLLLQLGANPRLANAGGETPIDRARTYGHEDCADLMQNWGANQ